MITEKQMLCTATKANSLQIRLGIMLELIPYKSGLHITLNSLQIRAMHYTKFPTNQGYELIPYKSGLCIPVLGITLELPVIILGIGFLQTFHSKFIKLVLTWVFSKFNPEFSCFFFFFFSFLNSIQNAPN